MRVTNGKINELKKNSRIDRLDHEQKKATYGNAKQIPDAMVRGWIRRKAPRSGKWNKEWNRSHTDFRKYRYGSVNNYEYMTYGDGHDDYNEYWLDNYHDPWIYNQRRKKSFRYVWKKKKMQTPSPPPMSQWVPISSPISQPGPSSIHKKKKYKKKKKMIQFMPMPIEFEQIPVPPAPVQRSKPVKEMYDDKVYKRSEQEEKEYDLANDSYVSAMGNIELYGIYAAMEGLSDRSTYSSHKDDKADPTSDNFKKIMKEIRKEIPKNLYTSINGSMFIRFDENNPRFLQALLAGIDDTPYESGLFLFDIYLGDDYPNKPLNIKHISKGATICHANNGPGGFSPNLHQCSGKVCLSLLGTWSGPGWEAGKSNVYQVVSTIMFMIFGADHPYYMEPSYGGWEGTVLGRTSHEKRVIEYDEEVMYHNAKYTILETLKAPYVGFEDVIRTHFEIKNQWILKTIDRWMKNDNYSDAFKQKMKPVIKEIKEEFDKLSNAKQDVQESVVSDKEMAVDGKQQLVTDKEMEKEEVTEEVVEQKS